MVLFMQNYFDVLAWLFTNDKKAAAQKLRSVKN